MSRARLNGVCRPVTRSSTSRAVEVGSLDLVRAIVGPVELARDRVQGQPQGDAQTGGHQVLHFGAVEVGPLDAVAAVVGPVELAGRLIHGQAARVDQAAVDDVLDPGAVQVCALNAVAVRVRPVEPGRISAGHRGADAFRKRRVGRVGVVGLDEPGVGQVDLAVPVDVPQGEVAGGKGQGRILAVRGDEQGVGEIDQAVGVDVPQQAACGHLCAGQAGQRFDLDLNRSCLHPEGRVDPGDQPRSRDYQSVELPLAAGRSPRPAGVPSAPGHHRPVQQHHRPRQALPSPQQPIQVHPGAHPPTRGVGRVPGRRVKTGRPFPVHQGRHPLTQNVEHLQAHPRRGRQLIRDDRRGIERVGVVLTQVQARRQRRGTAQRLQGKGEIAALIRGGAQRAPQVARGEQPHPGSASRSPRRQKHPTLQQRLGAGGGPGARSRCREAAEHRQQPSETAGPRERGRGAPGGQGAGRIDGVLQSQGRPHAGPGVPKPRQERTGGPARSDPVQKRKDCAIVEEMELTTCR